MKIHSLTSVENEGFMGRLYTPETVSKKSVIVISGSDGGIKNAEFIAEKFAERGINALAVAYFKIKGVKRDLNEVPVEYIEKAIIYLKEKTNCEKVAIYGISKGGELSLLSASLFSDIDCVVAVVPNYFVTSGFNKIGCPIGDVSAWSFRGKPVPFVPIVANPLNIFKSYLKNDVNIKGYYKAIVDAEINEEAVIKVEKSHAAILCLSALNDIVWPSKMASEKVVERLKNSDYPFDYQHITFDKVSHFLCPTPKEYAKKLKIFKIEKQHPNECNESREKSFELAVDWIKKYNNTDCEIRPIKPEEIDVLDDFLYEAIFQPDINNLAPKSIIEKPELQIYIKDFGKPDDNCLVAVCDGKIVGAVWTRIIDGFGSVDEKTPEFAISLFREFRGRGIGTNLMREMLELLRVKGYKQTSLAVQKKNYAVKMYKAIGFEIAKELDEEYLMIYKF